MSDDVKFCRLGETRRKTAIIKAKDDEFHPLWPVKGASGQYVVRADLKGKKVELEYVDRLGSRGWEEHETYFVRVVDELPKVSWWRRLFGKKVAPLPEARVVSE